MSFPKGEYPWGDFTFTDSSQGVANHPFIVKFFRNGRVVQEYKDELTTPALIEFFRRNSFPSIAVFEEEEAFKQVEPPLLLICMPYEVCEINLCFLISQQLTSIGPMCTPCPTP